MAKAPSSDPLDILLAHDAWATRALLERCRALSREQFHREFKIGLGSLHLNLTHIVSVMRRWADRLMERPVRAALHKIPERPDIAAEPADRAPDELLRLLDDAARDLTMVTAECRKRGLATTISLQGPGKDRRMKTWTFSRGCVLVHVATHGMHHRAQCLNMLRQLNVPGVSDNLPEISAVEWQTETELPTVDAG